MSHLSSASCLYACRPADRRLGQAHLLCLVEGGVDLRRILVHEGDNEALKYELGSLLHRHGSHEFEPSRTFDCLM